MIVVGQSTLMEGVAQVIRAGGFCSHAAIIAVSVGVVAQVRVARHRVAVLVSAVIRSVVVSIALPSGRPAEAAGILVSVGVIAKRRAP